jgi:zinc transporter ZupT
MNALLWSLMAFASTSAGGLVALRLGARVPGLTAFTSGVVFGVVAFDLLPELVTLARNAGGDGTQRALAALACGYLACHGLERLARSPRRSGSGLFPPRPASALAPVALVAHSLMDGVGIGLAFQATPALGFTVAIAVITHDFVDGLSTMNLAILAGGTKARALVMLGLDALAPLAGVACTSAFDFPERLVLTGVGLVGGFLLHVATGVLSTQARGRMRRAGGVVPAVLGAGFICLVVRLTQ